MEMNEVATRLFHRYWLVLLLAIFTPVLAMAVYVARQPAEYTAHGRVVASTAIPRSLAEAAAIVSQVQAIATSRDVTKRALDEAHLPRDPDTVIRAVVVTGLGSSTLVDVAYTDRDRDLAQKVTAALLTAVTGQLDAQRVGALPDVLQDVDRQLTDLTEKRAPIAAEAHSNPGDPVAQNKLAGIDRLISELSADRGRLAEEAAAAGHASVVATPTVPDRPDPTGLPGRLGIAAILGLAVGLILAGLNETVRPKLSGASRVGRVLQVPLLGTVSPDPAALADIGRRIRLAASQAEVSTVVLARTGRTPIHPEFVDRVEAAAVRPAPVTGRIAIPTQVLDSPVLVSPQVVPGQPVDGRPADGHSSVAVLTATENSTPPMRLQRVCALEELNPSAEGERIGLVVLTGGNVAIRAVDRVRDLATASGWPLLGVLEEGVGE
ncbi:hypothetical protein GCM10010399_24560 [Dactylosporangium fulvum]|uniref:Polysaccharide chain length determinant N-terminal domain-containing protein n=1 Tax=Dactylosporangium fulvum TaxID=53359 RepID=A0ABY5W6I1_9ACTN|nr:hypothetical protein [Dactylosporangium fulvum]UWP85502.1 hypothetical protein Dfulv_15175 [Dactylosporangium fulvum]